MLCVGIFFFLLANYSQSRPFLLVGITQIDSIIFVIPSDLVEKCDQWWLVGILDVWANKYIDINSSQYSNIWNI